MTKDRKWLGALCANFLRIENAGIYEYETAPCPPSPLSWTHLHTFAYRTVKNALCACLRVKLKKSFVCSNYHLRIVGMWKVPSGDS